MISKIEHIGIRVSDLQRSIDFYTGTLGLKLAGREDIPESNLRIAFIQVGESQLELLESNGTPSPNDKGVLDHVALTVTGLDSIVERLRNTGVELIDEEAKTVFDGRVKIFFFKGPDGEILELWEEQ